MISGIYTITNIVNSRIYVGSAVNIDKRLKEHRWALRKKCHCNIYLQRAWDKSGEVNFVFEEYLSCDIKDLIFFEQITIDKMVKTYGRKNVYNMCLTAGSTLGRMHSEESKIKIGLSSKGRWTGKHHTDETRKKMSIASKGKKMTPEGKMKISIANKGRKGYWSGKKRPAFSKEWKEKISKATKGHSYPGWHHSEEAKKKIGDSSRGRPSPMKGMKISNKPNKITK